DRSRPGEHPLDGADGAVRLRLHRRRQDRVRRLLRGDPRADPAERPDPGRQQPSRRHRPRPRGQRCGQGDRGAQRWARPGRPGRRRPPRPRRRDPPDPQAVSALPSDDRGWFELVLENQPPLWRLYVEACGGELFADGDVQAAIVAASPNRSFFNSAFYSDTDHLVELLPRLAEVSEDAGVNAWTVWIPAEDEPARDALAEAGHVLDATPRAMGFELSGLDVPEPDSELEIRAEMDMELIRVINETAYGYAA